MELSNPINLSMFIHSSVRFWPMTAMLAETGSGPESSLRFAESGHSLAALKLGCPTSKNRERLQHTASNLPPISMK